MAGKNRLLLSHLAVYKIYNNVNTVLQEKAS